MDILIRLYKLLKNYPVKSIFITVIIVILLVVGVQNVFMATGNDTLVKTNTDVYQDNVMLEQEFGGESIIVLYESDDLLTPNHLKHMKGIEHALKTSDSIYSMISPVTVVEEIAKKQSDTFQEGVSEIINGLDEMGTKLTEISGELEDNASLSLDIEFPKMDEIDVPEMKNGELPELDELDMNQLFEFDGFELPDMEGKMAELNKGFSNMIEAQENLEVGTVNLVGGYTEFSKQTNVLGENLATLADQLEGTPLQEQIYASSEGLIKLSNQMSHISEEAEQLPEIPSQTIQGLNNIKQKVSEQLQEQKAEQEKMQKQVEKQKEIQAQLQANQQEKQDQMKQQLIKEQEAKQEEMKEHVKKQQAEREKEMHQIQDEMQEKQTDQKEKLGTLREGLGEMGENLQTISENMETMYNYVDIMTPGIPDKQSTLDNIVYDDGELRPMFEEVIVDDRHMIMMIKFNGNTDDTEKSEVVDIIKNYLDSESIETAETLVSGKPVLDHAIRSSMQINIQKMMGLALLIMVIVLLFVFKVQWRLLPLLTVLIAVVGTVGLMGWLQIPITMVSMAVFPILIGLGIDYAIQFQNRYDEERFKEDVNE